MPFRFAILFAFFAFSIARADCEDGDFEIIATIEKVKKNLGCEDDVEVEITYGETLTLSVNPAKGTYEWLMSNTIIIKRDHSFSPEFSENPSSSYTETYFVRKEGGSIKTINVTVLERPSYIVSFDTDEDDEYTIIPDQEVLKDFLAKEPEESKTLTKTDYYFDGWSLEDGKYFDFSTTPITEDILLKAIWRTRVYVVSFDTKDGEPSIEPKGVLKGERVKEPTETITKTGYDFDGWDFDFRTLITEDITIDAKWKIKTFTVRFNSDGGSRVESQKVDYDSQASVPETEPTKKGYEFVRWDFDFDTPIEKDITIYAIWKAINLSSEERIEFADPGIYPDLEFSDIRRHYFVASASLCKKIDSTKIYITVKPDIVLRIKKVPQKTIDKDGLLYEIPFKFGEPGLDTLIYELISKDGLRSDYDTILIETPIPFDSIVKQKWNGNILFVNNNPETNGGYEFTEFKWFKNYSEKSIGNLQFYPAKPGQAILNPNDTYKVVMQTAEGIRISTCEGHAEPPAKPLAQTTKKLIKTKQVLGINEKSLKPGIKIYNLNGKLTKETPAGVYIVEE